MRGILLMGDGLLHWNLSLGPGLGHQLDVLYWLLCLRYPWGYIDELGKI